MGGLHLGVQDGQHAGEDLRIGLGHVAVQAVHQLLAGQAHQVPRQRQVPAAGKRIWSFGRTAICDL